MLPRTRPCRRCLIRRLPLLRMWVCPPLTGDWQGPGRRHAADTAVLVHSAFVSGLGCSRRPCVASCDSSRRVAAGVQARPGCCGGRGAREAAEWATVHDHDAVPSQAGGTHDRVLCVSARPRSRDRQATVSGVQGALCGACVVPYTRLQLMVSTSEPGDGGSFRWTRVATR